MLELSSRTYGDDEIAAINAVLTSGRVTMGRETEAFEAEFAEYIGVKHAVMVNSGSSANMLAMLGLDHTHHFKTVVAPALTWSTTITPFLMRGCRVTLVDCDPRTLQIDPIALHDAMKRRPDALIIAHIMGNACDMDAIKSLASRQDVPLIEDSCEALGTGFMGLKTGRFGATAAFSFYFSHQITTIEGGMVVTDFDDVNEKMRSIRSHGLSRVMSPMFRDAVEGDFPHVDNRFLFAYDGLNLRPTELQAAMGRVQLRRINEFNEKRWDAFKAMRFMVKDRPHLNLSVMEQTHGATMHPFAFPVVCGNKDKERFIAHMDKHNIHTRPIIAGNLFKHPAFYNHPLVNAANSLPNATRIMECGLYWGLHPNITDEQLRGLETALDSYEVGQ